MYASSAPNPTLGTSRGQLTCPHPQTSGKSWIPHTAGARKKGSPSRIWTPGRDIRALHPASVRELGVG